MQPSLDSAYIARQIMARNGNNAHVAPLAPTPSPGDAVSRNPGEVHTPDGTSAVRELTTIALGSSPTPNIQGLEPKQNPLGGILLGAAAISMPPVALQPSTVQRVQPPRPSPQNSTTSPLGDELTAISEEPAPKRSRRSSSASTRGTSRGRGRGTGGGGGSRGRRRGGKRKGQAQESAGRSGFEAQHETSYNSPRQLSPALQPRQSATALNPHRDVDFSEPPHSALPTLYQQPNAPYVGVDMDGPHPSQSHWLYAPTSDAYPPLNEVHEAPATPYLTETGLAQSISLQPHSMRATVDVNSRFSYDPALSTQNNHIYSQAPAVQSPPGIASQRGCDGELEYAQSNQQGDNDHFTNFQSDFEQHIRPSGNPNAYNLPHDGYGDEQGSEEDQDDDLDFGDDPLLAMQNNLATFEDSVRSFAAGGDEKSLLAQYRAEQQQPREKKVIKRGPRKPAEPTGDVKLRLSAATNAYMSGDLDEALRQVNDAIRLNAEIHRSWSLLSEVLRERGEYKQSLMASVCAAHLQPKIIDAWLDCGRFALELVEAEPDDADDTLKIAIMVFSQAIKIQPDNVGARQTRAALYLTRQSYKLAVGEYKWIIERDPYDLLALRGLADASVQLFENHRRYSDRQRWEARNAYLRAIKHFQEEYPIDTASTQLPFTWDDAFTYTALLLHIEQYGAALEATRSLARWLLGRREETFWDKIGDDREWDVGDERRRLIPQYDPNKFPPEAYGAGFAIRLRVNLAICRLRLDRDNDDEAMQHLEFLDPADVNDPEEYSQQPDLFLEVASALYETKRLTKALPFFEPLRQQEDLLDSLSLFRAGKCYLEIEDRRQAEQCFTAALDFDDTPSDVRVNARYELAKMYEAARKNEEALYLLEEAMGIEREQREGSGGSDFETSRRDARPRIIRNLAPKPILDKPPEEPRAPRERKPPGPRKPRAPGEKKGLRDRVSRPRPLLFALDEDRKHEEERRAAYLVEKWRVVREGGENSEHGPGESWMAAAKVLIDDFRSFKAFYPWDRYLAQMGLKQDESASSANPHLLKMAQRLRGEVDAQQSSLNPRKLLETTVSYRNVEFSEWLNLFLEFALSLAHAGHIKESYDVCDAALAANVFFENPDDKFLANITKAACAVRGRDEETCVEVARSFMATYQFCSDAFRMYAALGRLVHSSGSWFAHSKVQKFTLRQIKMMDTKLIPADQKTKTLEQFDPKTYPAKEQDVQLLMLYGHILIISNSFTFALNYFVRAAALDPDNLMVNISMGQAYLHYALKRQTENRQQSITQGLLFLHRYYDLKLAKARTAGQRQEAHYNLARSYHAIGLAHLAADYYRRVFREIEGEELGCENLAREAAFNLQQCCLIGGDMEAVRHIAERWLVI